MNTLNSFRTLVRCFSTQALEETYWKVAEAHNYEIPLLDVSKWTRKEYSIVRGELVKRGVFYDRKGRCFVRT